MFRTGDLFNPMLGIVPYWDKPLLSYWQILPIAYISGGISEFIVRFPSVFWAIIMVFLTYDLAKRWFDEHTALISIGILTTSYGFVFWGRNAQVEMTNATMIMLCLWYFFKHKSDNSYTWVYTLGIIMALGANMKGLTTYAVPIFCMLLLSFIKRRWSWLPPLRVIVLAGLLSITVFLVIPIAADIDLFTWDPLRMVWHENVVRFFASFDYKASIWLYFYRIFDLFAPWSLFLPLALVYYLYKARYRGSKISDIMILSGAIFIFFTILGSRRPYYLLPIIPFISILVGDMLVRFGCRSLTIGISRVAKSIGVFIGLTFITPLIVFALRPQIFPDGADALLVCFIILSLSGIAMIIGTAKENIQAMAASVAVVWLVYVIGVVPWAADRPNLKTYVAQVIALDRHVGFLYSDDAKVIFYLDKPYQVFVDKDSARNWAYQTKGVLITSYDISDPSWECAVDAHKWKAMILKPEGPLSYWPGPDISGNSLSSGFL